MANDDKQENDEIDEYLHLIFMADVSVAIEPTVRNNE